MTKPDDGPSQKQTLPLHWPKRTVDGANLFTCAPEAMRKCRMRTEAERSVDDRPTATRLIRVPSGSLEDGGLCTPIETNNMQICTGSEGATACRNLWTEFHVLCRGDTICSAGEAKPSSCNSPFWHNESKYLIRSLQQDRRLC